MNTLEILAMRKAIKKWRDGWTEKIEKDLEASVPELRALLFSQIDALKPIDGLRIKRYAAKKLQPLFVDWCRRKEMTLFAAAEEDLQNKFDRNATYSVTESGIDVDVSKDVLLNLASVTLSGAATVATIPAIVIFSSITVPAAGILGLLGFSATVVVTKNIVIGLIVLVAFTVLTYRRAGSWISTAKARLREQIEQQIQERIVYSTKQPSLAMVLTEKIDETAEQLLGELRDAA